MTCELPYSRAFAGALVFSKEFPDIAWGMSRCLARLGALPQKLVWDREGAIAPRGRPTEPFLAFCGQLALGWIILDAGDCQAKGALERDHRFLHGNFEAERRFANQHHGRLQRDEWLVGRAYVSKESMGPLLEQRPHPTNDEEVLELQPA